MALHRAFPVDRLARVAPFLLLEQMGPTRLEAGKAGGELDGRWDGFDAITYVVRGELEHEDDTGQRNSLRPGDVQWLTTGAGLACSQLPSREMREHGGMFHVLQVRLDLPPPLRDVAPRNQVWPEARLPKVSRAGVRITVVAGEAWGTRGAVEANAPTTFQIWSLDPGAALAVTVPSAQCALVYVLEGAVGVGGAPEGPREVAEGHLALLGQGDEVELHGYVAPGKSSLLLLAAGVPSAGGW